MVTTFRQAMTTDANTGSGTSNGTVFLMDTTMPTGTDDSTVSNLKWGKLNICTFFIVGIFRARRPNTIHTLFFYRDIFLIQFKND